MVARDPTHPRACHVILILDDNPADRAIFRAYLARDRETRYSFYEAELGDDALALCREVAFDCILLDHFLPDMDGVEFVQTLRDAPCAGPVPVVVVSAQQDEAVVARFLDAGAQAYLSKTRLRAVDLCDTVRSVISECVISR